MRKLVLTGVTTLALLSAGTLAALPAQAAALIIVSNSGDRYDAGTCDNNPACVAPDFTSIGAAVTAASDGDTIRICAGTYAENITTGKVITFQGQEHGVDGRQRALPETVIDGGGGSAFTLSGLGATIDGFWLQGATTNIDTAALNLNGSAEAAVNTVFDTNNAAAIITSTDATFKQNTVVAPPSSTISAQGGGGYGFFFNSGGGSASTVEDNLFGGDLDGGAINVADPGGVNLADTLTITGNEVDTTDGGNLAVLGGTRNVDIEDNSVNRGASSGTGILLLGDNASYTIKHNYLHGGPATSSAIKLSGGFGYAKNGGGSITSNFVTDSAYGVNVLEIDESATLHVNYNVVAGNSTAGVNDESLGTVDATNNYYGCDAGPGQPGCDNASSSTSGGGTVVYTVQPHLVLNVSVAQSSIVNGSSTTFTADLNHNNLGNKVTTAVINGSVPVAFAFDHGSVSPASGFFNDGIASTTLTGTTVGSGTATATTFASSDSRPVTVTAANTSLPALTIHDASAVEGNSGTHGLAFKVTMGKKATKAVTFHFTTANGSAVAGSDFVAKSGTVTIAKGKTTATVTIMIKGDKAKEPNESFAVNIFNPTNARIADPVGTGIIRNDDH